LAWFFEDEADAYAEAVVGSLAETSAVVPALWALEGANGALVGERRQRTTEVTVTPFLSLLRSLPISADDVTADRAWREPPAASPGA
jgi:hypothetical protein